jgi:hypothetical protein
MKKRMTDTITSIGRETPRASKTRRNIKLALAFLGGMSLSGCGSTINNYYYGVDGGPSQSTGSDKRTGGNRNDSGNESQTDTLSGKSRYLKCGTAYSVELKTDKRNDSEDVNLCGLGETAKYDDVGPIKVAVVSYGITRGPSGNSFVQINDIVRDLNGYVMPFSNAKQGAVWNSKSGGYSYPSEHNQLPEHIDAITFAPTGVTEIPGGANVRFVLRTAGCETLETQPKYCQIAGGYLDGVTAKNRSDPQKKVIFDNFEVVSDQEGNLSLKDIETGKLTFLGKDGGTNGEYKAVIESGMSRNFYIMYQCLTK